MPLEHLEQVQAATGDFAAAAFVALSGAGAGLTATAFGATQARLLAPVQEALQQYGDRELAYLSAELQQIAGKGGCRRRHLHAGAAGSHDNGQ